MVIAEKPSSTLPLPRMVSLQSFWSNIKVRSTHKINKHLEFLLVMSIPCVGRTGCACKYRAFGHIGAAIAKHLCLVCVCDQCCNRRVGCIPVQM